MSLVVRGTSLLVDALRLQKRDPRSGKISYDTGPSLAMGFLPAAIAFFFPYFQVLIIPSKPNTDSILFPISKPFQDKLSTY